MAGCDAHDHATASSMNDPAAPQKLDPGAWPDRDLTIANLGHASLLMNYSGVRVITDPTLFNRVGVAFDSILTIGPHRHVAPPLTAAEIGQLDVILITHAHMDHLDLPSLKVLPKTATVIACAKCAALIRPLGFNDVRELDWGESTTVKGLTVTAMAARHWGKRWPPFGVDYGFNSYVLERDNHRMLLACDSAFTDVFDALANWPLDIAAFSIGAYDPWIHNHANPEQVWSMFQQSGARYLIPIHWGTFKLSKEPMDEPMSRLLKDAGAHEGQIVLRQIGGSWTLPLTTGATTSTGVSSSSASTSGSSLPANDSLPAAGSSSPTSTSTRDASK
jgi:L-ascorbate metabolism protein UlaG (beta-lactamase superfamily)